MHTQAFDFIRRTLETLVPRRRIVEFGSRNVNGGVRGLLGAAESYVGVDLFAGDGVDEVGDAADWKPSTDFVPDTVICTEVLEHTPRAAEICANAHAILAGGGVFLLTAASSGREPHSATDGGALRPGEFYENVSVASLRHWLRPFDVALIDYEQNPGDVYALCIKKGKP